MADYYENWCVSIRVCAAGNVIFLFLEIDTHTNTHTHTLTHRHTQTSWKRKSNRPKWKENFMTGIAHSVNGHIRIPFPLRTLTPSPAPPRHAPPNPTRKPLLPRHNSASAFVYKSASVLHGKHLPLGRLHPLMSVVAPPPYRTSSASRLYRCYQYMARGWREGGGGYGILLIGVYYLNEF